MLTILENLKGFNYSIKHENEKYGSIVPSSK